MPLDHYVSQVHLKKFYSPILGNRMYATRKSDLKQFTPDAKSVCAIEGGSTNTYLSHDRAVEEFLKVVEHGYSRALESLYASNLTSESAYVIAGFAAYLGTCSPAAMRLQSAPLHATLKATAEIMDAHGTLPTSPPSLGGKLLTELLRGGDIDFTLDRKYPQAIGISAITELTASLGTFHWEILLNETADSPFFTSDYPVAIESTGDPRVICRIIPLAPNIAVRMIPTFSEVEEVPDFSFAKLRFQFRKLRRNEVHHVNTLIVRSAEDTVFYRDNNPWIYPFIVKNRDYRLEPVTSEIDTSTGRLILTSTKVQRMACPSARPTR